MSTSDLAIFGAVPAFSKPLPVGQLYFPDWMHYVEAMHGIFDRQYYTNQGPLVQQLEQRLQEFFGVPHVICVTNATIGLMMAAEALELRGKVVTPAFSFIATAQSLTWTGLTPVFCDIDPLTHQLDISAVKSLLDDPDISAILAVNLWGDACDTKALQQLAGQRGIHLYFDSAHAFGCEVNGIPIGNFGELEVFSFHATKVLSAAEGGCICTHDDKLAARLRNIRSSYGAGYSVSVRRTANGRMSEAQAAIALLSLDNFHNIIQRNAELYATYQQALEDISGLRLIRPTSVTLTNYQYVVCEIDETKLGLNRDELQAVLRAENVLARRYFYPGIHRCHPYDSLCGDLLEQLPITDKLCSTVLQLPIGQLVDISAAINIAHIIKGAVEQADRVREKLRVLL